MRARTTLLVILLSFFSVDSFSQTWLQKTQAHNSPSARSSGVAFDNSQFGFISLGKSLSNMQFKDCWKFDHSSSLWTKVSDFPGNARKNSFGFAIDSFAYVGAGIAGNVLRRDVYRYNMNSDIWDTLSNYPGSGRRLTFYASANGKGYVGGGYSTAVANDFYEYNPQNDSWRALPNLPFGNRSTGISFAISDTIYFGLGYNGSSDFNDLWAYSVKDSVWTQKASFLGVGRLSASVIVLNGKAIVGGGHRLGNSSYLSDYYIYDPTTNQWSSAGNIPYGSRAASVGFSISNSGYLFGGAASASYFSDLIKVEIPSSVVQWDKIEFLKERANSVGFSNNNHGFIALGNIGSNQNFKDCWKYDPTQNNWTSVADFPAEGRKNALAFSIDSFAYLGAGTTSTTQKRDMYRYNMNSDYWDTLVNYPGQGLRLAFNAVANGKAYVGGGITGNTLFNDFYEYNPNSDSWRSLPNIPLGNRSSGISFTIGDTIYFGLGYDGSNDYNDLWAYSVKDSSWSQKASLLGVGRLGATAFVVNGRAVVGGGYRQGSSSQLLSDYYEYDPVLNQWSPVIGFSAAARGSAANFSIGNKGYIFGGNLPGGLYSSDLWEYSNNSVSLLERSSKNNNLIYPNPSNGIFYLQNLENKNGEIFIYNVQGKLVYKTSLKTNQINLEFLEQGVYIFSIEAEESNLLERGRLVIH